MNTTTNEQSLIEFNLIDVSAFWYSNRFYHKFPQYSFQTTGEDFDYKRLIAPRNFFQLVSASFGVER